MKKHWISKPALALAAVTHVLMATPGWTQGYGAVAGDGSSNVMWGTTTGTPGSNYGDGAFMHERLGDSAGQVNAAQAGVLMSTNVTVMSIGSQNIISITGDRNSVDADQDASTTGNVTTNSSIVMGQQ